jgi:tetratricopeptide (TPR) repeat protein
MSDLVCALRHRSVHLHEAALTIRVIVVSLVCLTLALATAGCGSKTVRPATAGPAYPQFEFPAVSPAMETASGELVAQHREGWDLLQMGNTRAAERRFSTVTRRAPDFYPAMAGLGYVALAQQEYPAAVADFDKALAVVPDYVPALLGRATALEATNQIADAVAALDAVVKADPARAELKTRADSLRFRVMEETVAQARSAQAGGKLDEARTAWEKALVASPDSAYLYRELATTERLAGELDKAYAHAQTAKKLDDRDAATVALVGEIEEQRGHLPEAIDAYRQAQGLGGRADLTARITDLERRLAFMEMPEAFREIPSAPRVTRADLAALIGARLETWVASVPPASSELITDVRNHWAQRWILAVTRAGLMEVYPNHTFQPGELIQRADLAVVVSRTLAAMGSNAGLGMARGPDARPAFSDLAPGHASYEAAATAVAAGVLANGPDNAFQPTRPVSGAEAVAAVDRLEAMVAKQ